MDKAKDAEGVRFRSTAVLYMTDREDDGKEAS